MIIVRERVAPVKDGETGKRHRVGRGGIEGRDSSVSTLYLFRPVKGFAGLTMSALDLTCSLHHATEHKVSYVVDNNFKLREYVR